MNKFVNLSSKADKTPTHLEEIPFSKFRIVNSTCKPIVLVCCGAFNPITYLHLRIFESAANFIKEKFQNTHSVIGGYLSPVGDLYDKPGMLKAIDRCKMCSLAVRSSNWIDVATWESSNPQWTRTVEVLQHYQSALTSHFKSNISVWLLCGSDLLESLLIPGLWLPEHIEILLTEMTIVCIVRNNTDVNKLVSDNPLLSKHSNNIIIVNEGVENNISSTLLRNTISNKKSIKYLTSDLVIDYINENSLYLD